MLDGKVVIVTGASRGIGRAMALAFAREGANVVLAARTTDAAPARIPGTIDETAREIEALGRKAIALAVDVTQDEQVEEMARRTLADFGRIDVLVNNAGISFPASFADTPQRRWDLVMNVNLRGTVTCTKAVLPAMLRQGEGRVVNVSSYLAENLMPGMLSYSVSKIAIEKLTEGVGRELRGKGVAVNALRIEMNIATEGWTLRNPNTDFSTWEKPEAAAEATLWLVRQPLDYTGRVVTIHEARDGASRP